MLVLYAVASLLVLHRPSLPAGSAAAPHLAVAAATMSRGDVAELTLARSGAAVPLTIATRPHRWVTGRTGFALAARDPGLAPTRPPCGRYTAAAAQRHALHFGRAAVDGLHTGTPPPHMHG